MKENRNVRRVQFVRKKDLSKASVPQKASNHYHTFQRGQKSIRDTGALQDLLSKRKDKTPSHAIDISITNPRPKTPTARSSALSPKPSVAAPPNHLVVAEPATANPNAGTSDGVDDGGRWTRAESRQGGTRRAWRSLKQNAGVLAMCIRGVIVPGACNAGSRPSAFRGTVSTKAKKSSRIENTQVKHFENPHFMHSSLKSHFIELLLLIQRYATPYHELSHAKPLAAVVNYKFVSRSRTLTGYSKERHSCHRSVAPLQPCSEHRQRLILTESGQMVLTAMPYVCKIYTPPLL